MENRPGYIIRIIDPDGYTRNSRPVASEHLPQAYKNGLELIKDGGGCIILKGNQPLPESELDTLRQKASKL